MTPRSHTISSIEEARQSEYEVGFPLFVKGAVQSRKGRGWSACVTHNETEMEARIAELLSLEMRSRGRVVLRELVRLRHTREHGNFPAGEWTIIESGAPQFCGLSQIDHLSTWNQLRALLQHLAF